MTTLRAALSAALIFASFNVALAKLPPPAPMDGNAKAAAEEKVAKDVSAASHAKSQLAKVEDRVVARYMAEQKAKGIVVMPQIAPAVTAPAGATKKGTSSQPAKASAHSPAK